MSKHCLTLLFLVLAFGANAPAQCVLDPIRVERIEGYLLFGFQGQYRVLDKAEVRLLESGNTQTVIAAVPVGKDGHFEMADAKPGKYVLSARSEALIPASVDVEVTKPKGTGSKRLILAVLAADATKECGGASIKLQPKAEVDRVLSTAKRRAH
jgi:hypothetical protein